MNSLEADSFLNCLPYDFVILFQRATPIQVVLDLFLEISF